MHEVAENALPRDAPQAVPRKTLSQKEMMSRRTTTWIITAGGLTGMLVWVYDYDFFLNAGGPAAPVSEAILRTLHLQSTAYPVPVLVPLVVLVTAGLLLGAGLVRLLGVTRH